MMMVIGGPASKKDEGYSGKGDAGADETPGEPKPGIDDMAKRRAAKKLAAALGADGADIDGVIKAMDLCVQAWSEE